MNKIEALLRVILEDQAYLYALINRLEMLQDQGVEPEAEVFRQWEADWKEQTTALVEELIEDAE